MKKLNDFWLGALLTASIWLVLWAFGYADNFRGFDSTGAEVFTIALPVMIVWSNVVKNHSK